MSLGATKYPIVCDESVMSPKVGHIIINSVSSCYSIVKSFHHDLTLFLYWHRHTAPPPLLSNRTWDGSAVSRRLTGPVFYCLAIFLSKMISEYSSFNRIASPINPHLQNLQFQSPLRRTRWLLGDHHFSARGDSHYQNYTSCTSMAQNSAMSASTFNE